MNREKKEALNKESVKMMHRIFDVERIRYAYLYPNDGGERQESVLATTPENLANYVGSHFFDAEKMVVTDMCDRLLLDTYGGFINQCPDQNLCREINQHLVPIQMGDKEAGEILIVSRYKKCGDSETLEEGALNRAVMESIHRITRNEGDFVGAFRAECYPGNRKLRKGTAAR